MKAFLTAVTCFLTPISACLANALPRTMDEVIVALKAHEQHIAKMQRSFSHGELAITPRPLRPELYMDLATRSGALRVEPTDIIYKAFRKKVIAETNMRIIGAWLECFHQDYTFLQLLNIAPLLANSMQDFQSAKLELNNFGVGVETGNPGDVATIKLPRGFAEGIPSKKDGLYGLDVPKGE